MRSNLRGRWADVERFGKKKKEWFARFLQLPSDIPSHDTFGRVFARLDTSEFYACLQRWVRTLNSTLTDYVLTVKGNQPKLHAEMQKCFEDAGEKDYDVPGMRRLKKTQRGHGRIERREYYVMPAPKSLRDKGGLG